MAADREHDLASPVDPARDHLRGGSLAEATVLLEYGDYECPYSRAAYRPVQRMERRLGEKLCF
jgi:hypothetical protein